MTSRDSFTPLAITGLGCLFPGKPGTRGFWNTVLQGIDQIREIPDDRWRPSDHFDPDPSKRDMVYAARGAFLSPVPFSPAEYGITPSSLEATDTAQLLGLHVARQALLDAGYAALPRDAGRPLPRDRASVIVGVTSALELLIPLGARLDHPRWRRAMREAGVPEDRINDALSRIAASYPEWTEDSFPGLLGNVVAGRIASRFDLHGTNCVVDAACASSLAAVHQAAMELQSGRADIVVTGGIDTFTDVFMYACFSKTPALSKRGEARPFAADADGTILGEGIGLVVLKRLRMPNAMATAFTRCCAGWAHRATAAVRLFMPLAAKGSCARSGALGVRRVLAPPISAWWKGTVRVPRPAMAWSLPRCSNCLAHPDRLVHGAHWAR